jgi:hypothetical protein
MTKTILQFLLVSTISLSIFSCNKSSDGDTTLGPGEAVLKGTITLGTSTVNFESSGNNCIITKFNAGGTSTIIIEGVTKSAPYAVLNIATTGITTTGTFKGSNNFVISGNLELTNLNSDKTFLSEENVTIIVTKLNNTEFEGTFSGDLENIGSNNVGKVTNGSFKGRF